MPSTRLLGLERAVLVGTGQRIPLPDGYRGQKGLGTGGGGNRSVCMRCGRDRFVRAGRKNLGMCGDCKQADPWYVAKVLDGKEV